MQKTLKVLLIILLLTIPVFPGAVHAGPAEKADVSLDEKLGDFLPQDAVFVDETGRSVNLRNRIKKPTIIAPVYFGCVHVCPMLLTGLAQVLGRMDMVQPGKDFEVIALSFDEKDTSPIAADKKKNYLKAAGRPFPYEAWTFLTGSEPNIRKFTESIGFRFQRDGHEFSHPVTLVVVAPGGKIVRYIEGTAFLPFEVTMALTEAAEGKVGSPARKALLYCFSYDPLKKSYVFNVLKVTGTAMVLFVIGFFAYLMVSTGKGRKT